MNPLNKKENFQGPLTFNGFVYNIGDKVNVLLSESTVAATITGVRQKIPLGNKGDFPNGYETSLPPAIALCLGIEVHPDIVIPT